LNGPEEKNMDTKRQERRERGLAQLRRECPELFAGPQRPMSLGEAAAAYGLDAGTIRRAIDAGEIQAGRAGDGITSKYMILPVEIALWLRGWSQAPRCRRHSRSPRHRLVRKAKSRRLRRRGSGKRSDRRRDD
jgi:hypothetical protein